MDEAVRYLKTVCLTWEKLRVVYNLILFVEALACHMYLRQVLQGFLADDQYRLGIILFGVVANMFYCLGPLLETCAYVVLGRRIQRARLLLFAAGLVFSTGLILTLATELIP